MEGSAGGRCLMAHGAAVLLLLCSFALTSTCFSLRELSKTSEADGNIGEAAVLGSILFNGKELPFKSGSASAVEDGFTDIYQVGSETLEQVSPLETDVTEAAWISLNASLYCDATKMMFKASGPAAADLQVTLDDAQPVPLIQLPESCGYSIQLDALGLVVVVPFDGCGVTKKDQKYVLPMVWQETPVDLTCPVLTSLDSTSDWTGPVPDQQPLDAGSMSSRRLRRGVGLSYSDSHNNPVWSPYFVKPVGSPSPVVPAPSHFGFPHPFPFYPVSHAGFPGYPFYPVSHQGFHGYPFYPVPHQSFPRPAVYPVPPYNPYPVNPVGTVAGPEIIHRPVIQYHFGQNPHLPTTTKAPSY